MTNEEPRHFNPNNAPCCPRCYAFGSVTSTVGTEGRITTIKGMRGRLCDDCEAATNRSDP